MFFISINYKFNSFDPSTFFNPECGKFEVVLLKEVEIIDR